MKLKIWTDKSVISLQSVYISLLFPFWGLIPEPTGSPDEGRFDQYMSIGDDLFELTDSPDQADVFLCPISYEMPGGKEATIWFNDLAEKYQKKFLLFFNSDSDEPLDYSQAIIFRNSFYKSSKKENEFSLPGWSLDYIKAFYNGKIRIRRKKSKPVVGYCGYIGNFQRTIKLWREYLFGQLPIKKFYNFPALRKKCIEALKQDSRIATNFILRNDFWGGQLNSWVLRYEFIANIIHSDYVLVTRGLGNFSYRLYEVISCGRIPIFINTDTPLPFDHIIDYKNYFLWIEDTDVKYISDFLLSFHETIAEDEFIGRQYLLRNLYEEWLSPQGFFKNLWKCVFSEGVRNSG